MKSIKKKKILLLLLVFALIGVVGYGVYSYYWAQGSITQTGSLTVDSFDIELYSGELDGGSTVFINGTHEGVLNCEYDSGETFICSESISVYNNGTKDVIVEITNLDSSISGMENATITSTTAVWDDGNSDTVIYANSSYKNVDIIVEVEVPGYVEPGDEATQVTEPIVGGELQVTATCDITATEVHD